MIKYFQSGSRMSQAVVYGGMVHIAGQVANDRKAGIEAQTSDVLAKVDDRFPAPLSAIPLAIDRA